MVQGYRDQDRFEQTRRKLLDSILPEQEQPSSDFRISLTFSVQEGRVVGLDDPAEIPDFMHNATSRLLS
jgi:hypothetical protein